MASFWKVRSATAIKGVRLNQQSIEFLLDPSRDSGLRLSGSTSALRRTALETVEEG